MLLITKRKFLYEIVLTLFLIEKLLKIHTIGYVVARERSSATAAISPLARRLPRRPSASSQRHFARFLFVFSISFQTACSSATLTPTHTPEIDTVPGTQASTPTPASTPTHTELFLKYTTGPVVNSGKMSRGVAWGDYNKDGYPDLFVANSQGQTNFLYRNDGDGTFAPLEKSEIMQVKSNSESGNWVDYDNDGDLDLFVTNIRNELNFLFRNDGGDSFTRIMEGEIVSEKLASTGSCWADYDNDGDLDVFVTNRDGQNNSMFSNNGTGSFTKVTIGAIVNDGGDSRACGWADVDEDTDLDLYVGNAHETNFFYINNGDGTFAREFKQSFVNNAGYTYGLSWADVDNDDDLDLFVANMQEKNELYLNNGFGEFERVDYEPFTEDVGASKGNTWGDFDNDGDLDLFIANGTPDISDVTNYLYLNNGNGQFTRESIGALTDDNHISSGTAWADYNRDGLLDIFVSNWADYDQDNALYTNENSEAGNWVRISLVGTESNSLAIGATVRLEAVIDGRTTWQTRQVLGNTGYGSQNEQLLHFGLGTAAQIESLEVYWPSGIVDVYKELSVNTIYNFTEEPSQKQDIQGDSNTIDRVVNEGYGNYLLVPAGQFTMGDNYDEGSYDNGVPRERPLHTVYLDAFYIGEFEITNAEYKKFIDDGGYKNPDYWKSGGFGSATLPLHWMNEEFRGGGLPGNENFPVVGVSWYEAAAYCSWLSAKTGSAYRLPTEAEWEKAARGGDFLDGDNSRQVPNPISQRRYPWGNEIDGSYANYLDSGDLYDNGLTPVGYYDGSPHDDFQTHNNASPYGAYDMAGNVYEWVSDLFGRYREEVATNPQGPENGSTHVIRGSAFLYETFKQRSAYRGAYYFSFRGEYIGIRCVRAIPIQ